MAASFLMIVTGYVGAHVVSEGASTSALWIWGIVSTVFYVYLYVALWRAMTSSLSSMSPQAAASLRNATILLLSVFGVYPLAYAARVFFEGPEVTTALQIAFSVEDTNPEPVWISNVKKADGVQPTIKSVASLQRLEHLDLATLERSQVAPGAAVRNGTSSDGSVTGR